MTCRLLHSLNVHTTAMDGILAGVAATVGGIAGHAPGASRRVAR